MALTTASPVLVLAYVFPPDNYSGADRPYRFTKYLRQLGHPVTVLAAGEKDGVHLQGEEVYRVRGELQHLPRKNRAEQIARIAFLSYDEGATWVPRAVGAAKRWMRNSPVPVVFSTSPPVTTHLAALWVKRKYGARWIADFRDPLCGNPFRNLLRARLSDKLIERQIFRHADVVLANTELVADMWRLRYPDARNRIHVIWNGFDPDTVLPALPIPERPRKTLTHIGLIYGTRQPTILLRSIERLTRQLRLDANSLLVRLFGPAELEPASAELVEHMRSKDMVDFQPNQMPRDQSARLTAESDYLLLLDVLQEGSGLQVPAKLFEYIMIGRPILALTVRGSSVEQILSRCGIPHECIYPDIAEADLDAIVMKFFSYSSIPTVPSAWFTENFDARTQAAFLSRLISNSAPRTE
ncbi:MAG: glycosyltransferase [Acidobacteriaceae bacterium]|nr:glycosyltransferase [Acidobacteriaceae bacterium]